MEWPVFRGCQGPARRAREADPIAGTQKIVESVLTHNGRSPKMSVFRGNSSVGRARPCQGRGREFESRFPLQVQRKNLGPPRFFFGVSPGASRRYASPPHTLGRVAEWSCSGLQIRVRRFNSDLGLHLRIARSLRYLEPRLARGFFSPGPAAGMRGPADPRCRSSLPRRPGRLRAGPRAGLRR